MKQVAIVGLLLLVRFGICAQVNISPSFEKATLEKQMAIYRDATNSLTINDILKNKAAYQFKLIMETSASFGYDSSHQWIHLSA